MDAEPRRLVELTRAESLRLLGGVPIGRIVYTARALPAIFPVRHVLDGDALVIRTQLGAETAGAVVAYQVDEIGMADYLGWSVTVTGAAHLVAEPERARYERMVTPLVDSRSADVIRIDLEIVAGYRLVNASED